MNVRCFATAQSVALRNLRYDMLRRYFVVAVYVKESVATKGISKMSHGTQRMSMKRVEMK
jgi:hypothetical protein